MLIFLLISLTWSHRNSSLTHTLYGLFLHAFSLPSTYSQKSCPWLNTTWLQLLIIFTVFWYFVLCYEAERWPGSGSDPAPLQASWVSIFMAHLSPAVLQLHGLRLCFSRAAGCPLSPLLCPDHPAGRCAGILMLLWVSGHQCLLLIHLLLFIPWCLHTREPHSHWS